MRLSETKVHNVQTLVDHGATFDSGTLTHHLMLYRWNGSAEAKAGPGPLIFGAGTVQWVWGLDAYHDSPGGMPNNVENEYATRVNKDLNGAPDWNVVQATLNVMGDM